LPPLSLSPSLSLSPPPHLSLCRHAPVAKSKTPTRHLQKKIEPFMGARCLSIVQQADQEMNLYIHQRGIRCTGKVGVVEGADAFKFDATKPYENDFELGSDDAEQSNLAAAMEAEGELVEFFEDEINLDVL
jgi:hypothetical protein